MSHLRAFTWCLASVLALVPVSSFSQDLAGLQLAQSKGSAHMPPDPKILGADQIQLIWSGDVVSYVAAVPESSTWAMLLLGFAGIGFAAYRQNQNGPALPLG